MREARSKKYTRENKKKKEVKPYGVAQKHCHLHPPTVKPKNFLIH